MCVSVCAKSFHFLKAMKSVVDFNRIRRRKLIMSHDMIMVLVLFLVKEQIFIKYDNFFFSDINVHTSIEFFSIHPICNSYFFIYVYNMYLTVKFFFSMLSLFKSFVFTFFDFVYLCFASQFSHLFIFFLSRKYLFFIKYPIINSCSLYFHDYFQKNHLKLFFFSYILHDWFRTLA